MRDFRRNAIALALSASMARMASGQACADPALDDTLRLTLNVLAANPQVLSLKTADLNRDGATDIVTFDRDSGSILVFWGRHDRDFRLPHRLATPPVTGLVAVLDFHGLGKTDLLVQTESGLAILVGDGQGGFRQVPITGIETTVPPSRWAWTDLDGDGSLDVVVCLTGTDIPSTSPPSLETFLGDGRGAFRHAVSVPLVGIPSNWIGTFVLGDIDGDGRLDVVVSAPDGILLLRADGRGGFETARKVVDGYGVVQVGDLDGDGHADLLVTTTTSGQFSLESTSDAVVCWGDGTGAFSPPSPVVSGLRGGSFLLGDLDGDGRLDVVSNGDEGLAVRRILAGRTFAPPIHLSSVQSNIQTADIDGDGRTDLVPFNIVRSPFPVFVNRCRPGFARSFTVPIVLESRGVGGTLFSSEIVLTNRGSTEVTVDLTYTAAFGDGSGSASLAIPIGRQRILTDVISDLRSLGVPIPDGDGRGGSLRVRFSNASSPADVSVQSRVRSPFGAGEVGVGLAPLPVTTGLTGPSIVPVLRENGDDRTNLALTSLADPEDGDVTLRVSLVSTDPAHPGTVVLPDVTLSPGMFLQLDRVLASAGAGMSTAWARIDPVAGQAPYSAYAVINDRASGDGSVVPAVADRPNLLAPSQLLPVVVETDTFSTELILTNASNHEAGAYLTFASPAIGGPNHREQQGVVVPARGQVSLPAFAKALCAKWTGTGAPGVPCAGSLTIDGISPNLLAVARTTASGLGGHFGLASSAEAVPYALGSTCWLDGLRQDETHRTNVGLVNLHYFASAHYRLDVFDGDTGRLAATIPDVEVGTGGWTQINSLLYTYAPGVTNAYVRAILWGGSDLPVAYAVLNDGAGPGLGNGDGTFLPMQFVPLF